MSASFVILFWMVLLAPVGFLLGLVFVCVGGRIFGVPKKRLGCAAKVGLAVLFSGAFVVVMCGLGIYAMEKDSDDYWEYQGAWDFWRMPLEEPYQLVMIDTFDTAMIGRWKVDGDVLVGSIDRYEKRGGLVAGHTLDKWRQTESKAWFLFDCGTGEVRRFETKALLEEACAERGFGPPVCMESIDENWKRHWREWEKRKANE